MRVATIYLLLFQSTFSLFNQYNYTKESEATGTWRQNSFSLLLFSPQTQSTSEQLHIRLQSREISSLLPIK